MAKDFVEIQVQHVNKNLVPSASNAPFFTVDNFNATSEDLKQHHSNVSTPYPGYIEQTGRYNVDPYGRKPQIANTNVLQTNEVVEEEAEEDVLSQTLEDMNF